MPSFAIAGINIDLNLPLGFKSISPAQFSSVRMDRIVLKGELKPDFKLKSVKIKGNEARIIGNSFETGDIQLKEGMNSMLIELTDVNGRRRLVSYAVVYEPKPSNPGGGSPIITLDMTAEGYTAPAQKKLSTRTIRRAASVSAPTAQTNPNLDVIFSSPYANQVITEDKLKIGGRFNKNAGIGSITVNGQVCTLDPASGTFEGPILLSPEEARSKKVNCDSKDYILMKVDPVYHSGKNELKVKVTPAEGKPYEDRIIYYYYQLYVGLSTYGKTYTTWQKVINDDGSIGFVINGQDAELPYSYTQSYNKNMFTEPPFFRWEYEDHNGRALNYDYSLYFWTGDLQGRHWYYDIPAFYFAMDNYWNPVYYESPVGNIGPIRTINDTKLVVHTPPLEGMPFIIKLGNCEFLETSTMFTGVPELDIKDYRMNGISFRKLCGDFERREGGGEEDIAYIVIDDYKPDVDMELKLEAPLYETCFDFYALNPQGHRVNNANTCNKYFYATVEDGIRGDILIDSNNNGFLGGEDNAVEQNEPGCVFWVNDDDDYDESSVHPDDKNAANSSGNDSSDDSINGIRDLEDFMPINIAIPNLKEWTDTQNVRFYLRTEGGGKIRLFERVQDTKKEGESAYLRKLDTSKEQYIKEMRFILPSYEKEGQLIDPSWFNSEGVFHGIFEGVNEGSLKLILEVELGQDNNKKRVVLDEAYLTLKNIRDMYRFVNLREGPTESSADNKIRYRTMNVEKSKMFMSDRSSVYIFVHGAWTPKSDAIEWSSTLYKRLYISGYRGGFVGIAWHSDETSAPLYSLINPKLLFDNNWINSFQTGQVLADTIGNIKSEHTDSKINIMAHSLGGNLTSYALRLLSIQDKKRLVDNVFLIQVAVPGNSYATDYANDYYKNMYYISAAGNITGNVYNLYYEEDEYLYWYNQDIGGAPWTVLLGRRGLPVPLDTSYELLPSNKMHEFDKIAYYDYYTSESGALGRKKLISKLSNFRSYYRKFKTARPYGIQDHLSFGTKYYYDVKDYYMDILNPENMINGR